MSLKDLTGMRSYATEGFFYMIATPNKWLEFFHPISGFIACFGTWKFSNE